MNKAKTRAALKVIQNKSFRWMKGMTFLDPSQQKKGCERGGVVVGDGFYYFDRITDDYFHEHGDVPEWGVPNLDDPATIGCLASIVGLLREVDVVLAAMEAQK